MRKVFTPMAGQYVTVPDVVQVPALPLVREVHALLPAIGERAEAPTLATTFTT